METQTHLEEQILVLVAGTISGNFKKTKITPETHLQRELGLDSLGVLSLVFRFEEVFGIDLSQMDLKIDIAKLRTVRDVMNAGRDILDQARTRQNV